MGQMETCGLMYVRQVEEETLKKVLEICEKNNAMVCSREEKKEDYTGRLTM